MGSRAELFFLFSHHDLYLDIVRLLNNINNLGFPKQGVLYLILTKVISDQEFANTMSQLDTLLKSTKSIKCLCLKNQ